MRKKTSGTITPGCEDALDNSGAKKAIAGPELDLLRLIAQVLDESASLHDCYITLGTNRTHQAFMITVFEDGDKMYCTGLSWTELLEAAKSLL